VYSLLIVVGLLLGRLSQVLLVGLMLAPESDSAVIACRGKHVALWVPG